MWVEHHHGILDRPIATEVLLEVVIRHAVVQSSRPALECEAAWIADEDFLAGKVVSNFILNQTSSLDIKLN